MSAIYFDYINTEGLRLISASACCPSLRIIQARVKKHHKSIKLLIANKALCETIQSICKACPNLTTLRLMLPSSNINIDEVILTAARYCPMIEVLPTASVTTLGVDALATIHTLKELRLSSPGFTSTAVQSVLISNPRLTDISLAGEYIDDSLVRCIGRHCGNLRSISLLKDSPENSVVLSISVLYEFFCGCPLLEVVELSPLGENPTDTLRALFEYCHNLTDLVIYTGSQSNVSLLPIVAEPVLYTYNTSLTMLRIGALNMGPSASWDRSLRDIFTYCIHLTSIYLACCIHVTDEHITLMTQNCCKLNSLELISCDNITIVGMLYVATCCIHLETIDLTNMTVNDEFLMQLSLHFTSLTSLSIRCHKAVGVAYSITEVGIHAVLQGCTGLSFLTVHGKMVESLYSTLDLPRLGQMYTHVEFDIGP